MPSTPRGPLGPQFAERLATITSALVVVCLIGFLLVRNEPIADPKLFFALRVILSFSAAVLGATIPGILDIKWSHRGLALRAGGALALFVLTFVYTPDVLADHIDTRGAKTSATGYLNVDHVDPSGVKTRDAGLLNIDDVIISTADAHVVLDVRVRNTGGRTVNITRANLHVIHRMPFASVYHPSAAYDLLLQNEGDNQIAIAHVLSPDTVDRFLVRVGFTPYNTSCGFAARLILTYDGTREVSSGELRFASIFH